MSRLQTLSVRLGLEQGQGLGGEVRKVPGEATWFSYPTCSPILVPMHTKESHGSRRPQMCRGASERAGCPSAFQPRGWREAHWSSACVGMYALGSLTKYQKRPFIPPSFPRSLPSFWQVAHAPISQVGKQML